MSKLKELKALLKLLKDNGVTSYKAEGLELIIDPVTSNRPTKRTKAFRPVHIPGFTDPTEGLKIDTDELSAEDLLFYSASGQNTDQQ